MQACWKPFGAAILFLLLLSPESCGSGSQDICACTPDRPALDDFRHFQKHIPLPAIQPIQITVVDMLGWTATKVADGAPRQGRELELFHIANAYVQFVELVRGDCDIHIEISGTPDKNAPRVIVETPVDAEYCPARRALQQQLASRHISLFGTGQEVTPPIPAEVLGMAFQDFEHTRGTPLVKTTWELHPAVVTLH